jgi:hypothetical protein
MIYRKPDRVYAVINTRTHEVKLWSDHKDAKAMAKGLAKKCVDTDAYGVFEVLNVIRRKRRPLKPQRSSQANAVVYAKLPCGTTYIYRHDAVLPPGAVRVTEDLNTPTIPAPEVSMAQKCFVVIRMLDNKVTNVELTLNAATAFMWHHKAERSLVLTSRERYRGKRTFCKSVIGPLKKCLQWMKLI